ncbi:MAG: chemotaxis protein CheV [Candidatus Omnitrophica bacterium]|nr:chemotaxis protein CheV [Candidatus Omnitrophota bacterium]
MTTDSNKQAILLESGTNELEIVEFAIADALYAINIAKVREIIKADIDLVSVPDAHNSIEGAINLRGKIIPVINLAKHLNEELKFEKKINRIIIAEFNKLTVGFLVSSVAKIHRLSWRQVEQPSDMLQTEGGYAVGIIKINEKVLFLLDFEKITANINPNAGIVAPKIARFEPAEIGIDRSTKVVLVAEDSEFTRGMIIDYLTEAGYKILVAHNGEEAWSHIEAAINSSSFARISDYINLVITDIEMPQVDGLHLIKRIKDEKKSRSLPCIAFSSMITPELTFKCKQVGADGEIAKPDIGILIDLVDSKVS